MSVENIVKVVEKEVEEEVKNIISSALREKEKILNDAKSKVDEEFQEKVKNYQEEINKKLSLEKLFLESEANKAINRTVSEVFNEIYFEVVKKIEEKFLSLHDSKELIFSIIEKSIQSLQLDSKMEVLLSPSDFEKYGDEIKKEFQNRQIFLEILKGDIKGGVIIKQGNVTVDASLGRIIKMFEPFIYNAIYKKLPKVTL